MTNIRESEVLRADEFGREIATSYDPGAFSEDTVRTILNSQITSPTPLEIHCYVLGDSKISGVYHTIEAIDFIYAKNRNTAEREHFIDACLALIKGLSTIDVIFAEPLKNKSSSYQIYPQLAE
jgi:hypothetical protein